MLYFEKVWFDNALSNADKGHARGNAFQVPTREKQSLYNIPLDKFLIANLETRFGDTTTSYINILFVVKIGFESWNTQLCLLSYWKPHKYIIQLEMIVISYWLI